MISFSTSNSYVLRFGSVCAMESKGLLLNTGREHSLALANVPGLSISMVHTYNMAYSLMRQIVQCLRSET